MLNPPLLPSTTRKLFFLDTHHSQLRKAQLPPSEGLMKAMTVMRMMVLVDQVPVNDLGHHWKEPKIQIRYRSQGLLQPLSWVILGTFIKMF